MTMVNQLAQADLGVEVNLSCTIPHQTLQHH